MTSVHLPKQITEHTRHDKIYFSLSSSNTKSDKKDSVSITQVLYTITKNCQDGVLDST